MAHSSSSISLFPVAWYGVVLWDLLPSQIWLWAAQSSFPLRLGVVIPSTAVTHLHRAAATPPPSTLADLTLKGYGSQGRLTREVLENTDAWTSPWTKWIHFSGTVPGIQRFHSESGEPGPLSLGTHVHVSQGCYCRLWPPSLEQQAPRACLASLSTSLSFQIYPCPKL